MEIINYVKYKFNRAMCYLIDSKYSEKELKYLENIGCSGLRNERPYDFVIVISCLFYFVVLLLYTVIFVKYEGFVGKFAFFICNAVWIAVLIDAVPMMHKDNERMRRNVECIEKERRRRELRIHSEGE